MAPVFFVKREDEMIEAVLKKINRGLVKTSLLFLVMSSCFLAGQTDCFAETVEISWDANTEPTLAGYKVYYKSDSSALPFDGIGAVEGASPVNVQNQTTATISGLDPNRTHHFSITAYDTSGAESPYSAIVTILEGISPTTAITAPVDSGTVSGTVSVTADASDNVGVTKIEFYVNGILQATDTATPYVYSWNTSALATGSYTVMTKAYDAAGNIGQSSTVSVNIVNDNTAPVVSLISPANNTTVSGTTAIIASASDNVGVSNVEFYLNGAIIFASNVAPYAFNWDTLSVANGTYALTARAYDNAGNAGQSSNISVTVNNVIPDTTAPIVTGFALPLTSGSTTVAISAFTATDNIGVSGYMVTESAAAPASSASGWSASAPASFTFSSAGSKTAYAWARDSAGNVSLSLSAAVAVTLPDAAAPTVSIRVRKASGNANGVLSVTATANDNVSISRVEFFVNGTLAATSTTEPYVFGWDSNAVANGSYSLIAKAYDAAGNMGQSGTVTVSIPNVKFR